MQKITYFGTEIEVQLGDAIKMKRWFRNVDGMIVYVPGVSVPNKFFGVGIGAHVGIQTSDGLFYGVFVSEVGVLRETVSFIERRKCLPPQLPDDLDEPGISSSFCEFVVVR